MRKLLFVLCIVALCASITGCNSSSSNDSSSTSGNTLSSGAVVAAPVKDANVMVDYEYLTDSTKKAMATKEPIAIGKTDKTGKIIFDAQQVAKLDRTKNIVLFSKGGVKFTSQHNTTEEAIAATDTADLFNGTLQTVLAPNDTTAYLTVANTLVATITRTQGVKLTDAKRLVKKLIVETMRVKTLTNPLGNPTEDLVESEIVSQTLIKYLDTTEDEVSNGTDLRLKLETVSNKLAENKVEDAQNDHAFFTNNFDEIRKNAKTALNNPANTDNEELTNKVDALKKDDLVDTKTKTASITASSEDENFTDGVQHIPYASAPTAAIYTFTIKPTSYEKDVKASFTIASFPTIGTFSAGGETITATSKTTFNGNVIFTFALSADEVKSLAGQTVAFTFTAPDSEYVTPCTVTYTFAAKDTLAIAAPTFSPKTQLILFSNADTTNYASISDSDANIPATAKFSGSFSFDSKNISTQEHTLKAVFTAPEGFEFAKANASLPENYSITDGALAITRKFEDGLRIESYSIQIDENTVVLKNSNGPKAQDNAGLKTIKAALYNSLNETLAKTNANRDAKGYPLVFAASGTEDTIQQISLDKDLELYALPSNSWTSGYYHIRTALALSNNMELPLHITTWNSISTGKIPTNPSKYLSLRILSLKKENIPFFPQTNDRGQIFPFVTKYPKLTFTEKSTVLLHEQTMIGLKDYQEEVTLAFVYDPSSAEGDEISTRPISLEKKSFEPIPKLTEENTTPAPKQTFNKALPSYKTTLFINTTKWIKTKYGHNSLNITVRGTGALADSSIRDYAFRTNNSSSYIIDMSLSIAIDGTKSSGSVFVNVEGVEFEAFNYEKGID